jgi:hypothetical protein
VRSDLSTAKPPGHPQESPAFRAHPQGFGPHPPARRNFRFHNLHHARKRRAQTHCTAPPQAVHVAPSRDGGGSAMIRERLDDIRFIATLAAVAMFGSLLAGLFG